MNWKPSTYLTCISEDSLYNCFNPSIIFPEQDMNYQVEITDENGCTASDELLMTLTIEDQVVFIPNVFSPNRDGVNDLFFVQAHGSVKEINLMSIYNRWGSTVFERQNFAPNDKELGWNGQHRGKVADVGVYIYIIKYTTLDGREETMTGDVLLVR